MLHEVFAPKTCLERRNASHISERGDFGLENITYVPVVNGTSEVHQGEERYPGGGSKNTVCQIYSIVGGDKQSLGVVDGDLGHGLCAKGL